MDSGTRNYVASSEQLAHEIEQTRAALGEKISALNHEVRGAFYSASDRMKGSIRNAREAVSPTLQFHRHPWAFCGSAFVVGFLLQRRMTRTGFPQETSQVAPENGAIRRLAVQAAVPLLSEAWSAWRKREMARYP